MVKLQVLTGIVTFNGKPLAPVNLTVVTLFLDLLVGALKCIMDTAALSQVGMLPVNDDQVYSISTVSFRAVEKSEGFFSSRT